MSPAERAAHDHAYRALKLRLHRNVIDEGGVLNVVNLTAELGVSRTPIREALFRLVGEGIVEVCEQRGFRLHCPDMRQLEDLYGWQMQMVLTSLHLLERDRISQALEEAAVILSRATDRSSGLLVPLIFQKLADATTSREISRQMEIANDRLILARRAESRMPLDEAGEERRLLKIDGADVKMITRRRVSAYFTRRMQNADTIADWLSR